MGFTGQPDAPLWLAGANVPPQQATQFIRRAVQGIAHLQAPLDDIAKRQGQEWLAAHRRVRTAAWLKGVRYRVQPQFPPGVLGAYLLVPCPG